MFFKRVKGHTLWVTNMLKGIRMKEFTYRDKLISAGIDHYIAYYCKILEKFMAVDLGKINK